MNREHCKKSLADPFFKAFADGKIVQFKKSNGEWETVNFWNLYDYEIKEFRIKPEPKLRPWRAEEVPILAWIRPKHYSITTPDGQQFITAILAYDGGYIWAGPYNESTFRNQNLDGALKFWEHSLDRGATWLPCGVLETT